MTGTAIATAAQSVDWRNELAGAQYLVKSGLCPTAVKTPEAALYIILAGRDLGLSAVQSLRSIHVIQGKVEVAADMQLGLFHRSGGRSRWVALSDTEARLELRAGWLLEPHVETFTMDDAKRAKLGGDNWQKYPKAMLRSRAITAGLKSIGFDPVAGVYAEGEISHEVTPPPVPTARPEPAVTTAPAEEIVEAEIVDDAEVVLLPGKPESWGGFGQSPITECPTKVLLGFLKWVDGDAEKQTKFATEAEAIRLLLDDRAEGNAEEPARRDEVAA